MKYEVWQINIAEDRGSRNPESPDYSPKVEASSRAMFDGYDAVDMHYYEHVANIEAENLDDVFRIGNIGPESAIERLAPMHSVSVGDLIKDGKNGMWSVEPIGFKDQMHVVEH